MSSLALDTDPRAGRRRATPDPRVCPGEHRPDLKQGSGFEHSPGRTTDASRTVNPIDPAAARARVRGARSDPRRGRSRRGSIRGLRSRSDPPGEAERGGRDDRRPDGRADARPRARAWPDRGRRDHLHAQLLDLSPLLPLAGHLSDRPVLAQPPRPRQLAARGRLLQAQLEQHPARVAQQRRLCNRPHRQVPERLRETGTAPGSRRLARMARLGRSDDLQLLRLLPQRERPARDLRRRPRARQGLPWRRSAAPCLPG